MYQNFISRHFSNQSSIIVLVNWPRAHRGVLQLTEASSLGPDSPRASPRDETVKQCRRQMTMANSPVQWPSWTWCRTWWNHSWHISWATLNQRCFASFVRALLRSFHELRATGLFSVAPHRDEWSSTHHASLCESWATSAFVGLNMDRTGDTDWHKTKFSFGNIVPKQWTLSGFVQRTSANSMYKDDNKISQQQKVLYMNKMLERVTHFQTSFSVGIQPRNHRGSTHSVHHYPSFNCILSVFFNINGERKHIDDLEK